jgi:hypothetical protein
MVSSELTPRSRGMRRPLTLLVLSLAVFFTADYSFFRTGIYARFVPPVTTAGRLARFVLDEENRAPSGAQEVLATGNSKMQFALWDRLAEEADPQKRLKIIQGSLEGSSDKRTYYILKKIDPTHHRYAAIILSDSPYRISPTPEDLENEYSTAQVLASVVPPRDWAEFADTFDDPAIRQKVRIQGVFSSRGVGMDLLLSSGRIIQRIVGGGPTKLLTEAGHPESVLGLRLGPVDRRSLQVVSYPAHFDSFQRREAQSYFQSPDSVSAELYTLRSARFHQRWLSKIIDLYRGSPTRLIFVQMPRWPVELPRTAPLSSAPDIRDLLPRQENVTFLDKDEFSYLEDPKYFWDVLHLNQTGRRLFSQQMGGILREAIDRSGTKQAHSTLTVPSPPM